MVIADKKHDNSRVVECERDDRPATNESERSQCEVEGSPMMDSFVEECYTKSRSKTEWSRILDRKWQNVEASEEWQSRRSKAIRGSNQEMTHEIEEEDLWDDDRDEEVLQEGLELIQDQSDDDDHVVNDRTEKQLLEDSLDAVTIDLRESVPGIVVDNRNDVQTSKQWLNPFPVDSEEDSL